MQKAMLKQPATRRLLYFRLRKGYTLMDLSVRTGLSVATLHRLERGRINPTLRSRIRLMDGLKLTHDEVDALMTADDGALRGREEPRAMHASV